MEKKSLLKVLFFTCLVILIFGIGIFAFNKINGGKEEAKTILDDNQLKDDYVFDLEHEKGNLEDIIKKYQMMFNLLVVREMNLNYQKSSRYELPRDEDLFSLHYNDIFFVTEYLVENNPDAFVTVNPNTLKKDDELVPTDDAVLAYCSKEDFLKASSVVFGEEKVIPGKAIDSTKDEYAQRNDYVYYENVRSGSNGLSVSIEVNDIVAKNNTFEASVKVRYSDGLKEKLNMDSSDGVIVYLINRDYIYLKSFYLK